MRDTIQLRCHKCGHIHHYNSHFIEGVLKGMKREKEIQVVTQLQLKRGPFYDRWKVAMEARGEQKRCRGCRSRREDNRCTYLTFRRCAVTYVNPGQFACGYYDLKE